MTLTRINPLVCLTAGLLVGFSADFAFSQDQTKIPPESNPNVVILRSEKIITLKSASMTLPELASELSQQTGYRFTLDKRYDENPESYSFLLSKTPLKGVLSATAYLLGGQWVKKGSSYHLRPATPEEMASDTTRFEADIARASEYLDSLDPKDSRLSDMEQMDLRLFQDTGRRKAAYPWSPDSPNIQSVLVRDGSLDISFLDRNGRLRVGGMGWKWRQHPENDETGKWRPHNESH